VALPKKMKTSLVVSLVVIAFACAKGESECLQDYRSVLAETQQYSNSSGQAEVMELQKEQRRWPRWLRRLLNRRGNGQRPGGGRPGGR